MRLRQSWIKSCGTPVEKRRFNLHSLLSSRLISTNVKVKIYKIVILPTLLYGCETWSLTLRDEQAEDFREWGAEGVAWV
jgi:hypothetical protein